MYLVTDKLKEEYQYFIDNQKQLLKDYSGKFVVIKNQEVIGAYDDEVVAYTETTKLHVPGTFIIQKATSNARDAQVFHSRVTLR